MEQCLQWMELLWNTSMKPTRMYISKAQTVKQNCMYLFNHKDCEFSIKFLFLFFMFNILCRQIFVHGMSHFRYFADYSTRAKCNQGFFLNEVLWLNLGILTALLKIFSHFILWHKIHTYQVLLCKFTWKKTLLLSSG